MERKLASLQKISKLEPIVGAELIERATVLGWHVVVKRGEFKEGDWCIFFEIDSLLPMRSEFEFMSKDGIKKTLVNGKEIMGYRLKTVRLRGQISQGLALPVNLFPEIMTTMFAKFEPVIDKKGKIQEIQATFVEGQEVTGILGVVKYDPPVPFELAGKVKGIRPYFVPKTDETRIQTVPQILERYKDVNFIVTEKLDGTSISVYLKDGEFGVCGRNMDYLKDENNTLWKAVTELDLETKMPRFGQNVVLQGELVGENIQGNPLKISGHRIYFYNLYLVDTCEFVSYGDFIFLIENWDLLRVPVIMNSFNLPPNVDKLVEFVSNLKSRVNPEVMPEGVVIRPWIEQKKQDPDIGRLSFKVINPQYLLDHDE